MVAPTKPDLVSEGLALLPSIWSEKPKIKGLLESFLNIYTNPIDNLFEILNGTSLEDAEGTQLDIIGKLWGEDRKGRADQEYREAIFLKITNGTLDSTPERIYEVMAAASGATVLKLFEYPAHSYLYMNVGAQESLKTLALDAKPAGAGIDLFFPPIEDDKLGTLPTAFEYEDSNLLIGSWTDSDLTYTANVHVTPESLTEGDDYEDTSAVNFGYRSQVVSGYDSSERYFHSIWILKDAGATVNPMLSVELTGGIAETYDLEISPVDGSYNVPTDSPLVVRVHDFGDWIFGWMEMEAADLDNTVMTIKVYGAASATLGTLDATLLGTTGIWRPVTALVDSTMYEHITSEATGFICSTIIREEFFVVDEFGDNVIDEFGDLIVATALEEIIDMGATPIGLYDNIVRSQPLVVVK